LRLYEYEAKQLFQSGKIPIPRSTVVTTGEEAEKAAREIGGPAVLKAQILTGGRGKAGGILMADTPQEAREVAGGLLGSTLKGYRVERLLVEEKLSVEREYYLGITIDRAAYRFVVIGSAEGGVEIEEVARRKPEAIHRMSLNPGERLYSFQGIDMALQMGLSNGAAASVGRILAALYGLFMRYDGKLMEINPLVQTTAGDYIAADARISIDEDALYRHPDLAEMGIEERWEEGELTERERWAKAESIPYVDLDGAIGMFPGGAGFGIMGNDFVNYYGGSPANFMDSGGGPTPERLATMLTLLDENPQVKVIFGARFGGISRCDDFAKGVIMFLKDHGLSKPMAMRMTGNMWQEGMRLFEEAKRENPELFEKIEIHGIETPIEDVVKRAVEMAKSVE
jgi:succinyl-CoA synthetase beta subunit